MGIYDFFKKKIGSQAKLYQRWQRSGGTYVLIWSILEEQVSIMETLRNSSGTNLYNKDIGEFLRNKLP